MSDTSQEFENKKRLGRNAESPLNPAIVELVKFLARNSARRDYNRLLQEQNKPNKEPS
jgi:hypothetical protein